MILGLQSKLAGLMFWLSILTEKKDFLFPEGRGFRNLIIPIKLMRVSRNQVNNLDQAEYEKCVTEWQMKTEQHEDGSGLFAFLLAGQRQHKERRSQKELMRDLPWEPEEYSKVPQQGCTEGGGVGGNPGEKCWDSKIYSEERSSAALKTAGKSKSKNFRVWLGKVLSLCQLKWFY